MTPTQRRLLARALKILALALEHGRWSDAELWPLVEKAKPSLDELHADLRAKCEPTPWEWTVEKIEAVTKCHALAAPVDVISTLTIPEPEFKPHYTEPTCKPQGFGALFAGRGMELSQPAGDRV